MAIGTTLVTVNSADITIILLHHYHDYHDMKLLISPSPKHSAIGVKTLCIHAGAANVSSSSTTEASSTPSHSCGKHT